MYLFQFFPSIIYFILAFGSHASLAGDTASSRLSSTHRAHEHDMANEGKCIRESIANQAAYKCIVIGLVE